jgi:hypothetical protein
MALSSVSVVALKSRRAITRFWMMALENSKVLLKTVSAASSALRRRPEKADAANTQKSNDRQPHDCLRA